MVKKYPAITGLIGIAIGVIGGIAGTAYSMGADRQIIENLLAIHDSKIATIKLQQQIHKIDVNEELNRFSNIVVGQISQLQASITELTTILGNVGGDVKVLKALMERVEDKIKNKSNTY